MSVLTVIIPTFNRSSFVREAIDSVLGQRDVESVELIVVNDGSTDDTESVLSSYGDRITVISQPNRGLNAARNVGLAAASGEFVSFLDDDDVMLPFKCSLQIQVLKDFPQIGFVFSDFAIWRDGVRHTGGLRSWQETESGLYDLLEADKRKEFPYKDEDRNLVAHVYLCDIYGLSLVQPVVLPSATLCRMTALRLCGPLPEHCSICGDWGYFAELSKRTGSVYIDVETALNRSHSGANRLTNSDFRHKIRSRLRMIDEVWCADMEFLAENRDLVNRTIGRLAESLYRSDLNAGDSASAAEDHITLRKTGFRPRLTTRLLWMAVHVPGGIKAIRLLVDLRRRAGRNLMLLW